MQIHGRFPILYRQTEDSRGCERVQDTSLPTKEKKKLVEATYRGTKILESHPSSINPGSGPCHLKSNRLPTK